MIIGVPTEIKESEKRVAMVPAGVHEAVRHGHEVLIQSGAGVGSGFSNQEFAEAGAELVGSAEEVWSRADMIVKVKEPLPKEFPLMKEKQVLFTYLHLAAAPELTGCLIERNVTAIAYETVRGTDGSLPLLTPMSEVAGRMAVQIGVHYLESFNGGRGILLSGVPGVMPGTVTIIGAGVAGTNAAKMAAGMGARVTILDVNAKRLQYLDDLFGSWVQTLYSNRYSVAESVKDADLVISTVLVPGARAPKVVTGAMVKSMRPGSVIVDVAIDQGGSVETIPGPTTHANPVFVVNGVIHYAVANIPGIVPRTSTLALTNSTLPYVLKLADLGFNQACKSVVGLGEGVNIVGGRVANKAVAESLGYSYAPLDIVA